MLLTGKWNQINSLSCGYFKVSTEITIFSQFQQLRQSRIWNDFFKGWNQRKLTFKLFVR